MAANKKAQNIDEAQRERDLLSDELISLRFLAKVGKVMEDKNITKKDLAKKLDTSPSYITQLFQGDKLVNVRLLTKIKRALNVTIEITCQPVLPKPEVIPQQLALGEKKQSLSFSLDIFSSVDNFSTTEEKAYSDSETIETVIDLTFEGGTWVHHHNVNN